MADPDLDFDDILDEDTPAEEMSEQEIHDRFYSVDAKTGEVFDPNADAPESVQNGTADLPVKEAPIPEAVGEVTTARIDPNNPPEPDVSKMTALQRREYRKKRIKARNAGR